MPQSAPAPVTVVERICSALTEAIVTGSLAPAAKLDEVKLAERFAVSRTPVREALRQLSARGLVTLTPRKGGTVASTGAAELAAMLDTECELEALCARLAAHRMTALEKKQLEALHRRSRDRVTADDHLGYLACNRDFHDLVCGGTHNEHLAALVRGIRDRLGPFRSAQSGVERRLATSFDEHGAVVEAILAADAEGAFEAMRAHNARLSSRVLELLARR